MLSAASINSTASIGYSSLAADDVVRTPKQTLDQNDFLKLLTTQLTHQDPMNPQQDAEFVAQMAQFGSLEQTKTMAANLEKLLDDQQFLKADGLIGKTVELKTDKDDTALIGVVEVVRINDGTPVIVVNGEEYGLSEVLSIQPTQTTN